MIQKIQIWKVVIIFAGLFIVFSGCDPIDIPVIGDIDGVVTDAETNQPIQGANVNISPSNASTTTGTDGKYSYKNLDPKEYTIQVQKDGYVTNTKTITVVAGQTNSGDVTLVPIIPELAISVTSLDFGNNLTSLPVAITNTGEGTLTWSISEDADWISVNPLSGSTTTQTSNIIISIDRSGLTAGTHSQVVSITSNGGNSTITVTAIK